MIGIHMCRSKCWWHEGCCRTLCVCCAVLHMLMLHVRSAANESVSAFYACPWAGLQPVDCCNLALARAHALHVWAGTASVGHARQSRQSCQQRHVSAVVTASMPAGLPSKTVQGQACRGCPLFSQMRTDGVPGRAVHMSLLRDVRNRKDGLQDGKLCCAPVGAAGCGACRLYVLGPLHPTTQCQSTLPLFCLAVKPT